MEDLKDLMGAVAAERLEYARSCDAGDEKGDAAFKQGITAFNAYVEMSKIDDAHNEEIDRQELEKERQLREEEMKRKESRKDRWAKAAEVGLMVVAAPVVGYLCNKSLAKFLCEAEQFENFTSTAGRSLGKMFKFK